MTAVVLLAFPVAASAQINFSTAAVDVFGGISMPMGDFGDDESTAEGHGFANMGFTLGADAILPLGSSGKLGWITSASINSFGVEAEDAFGTGAEAGRYWDMPLMTGINYRVELSPTMALYPVAQIGVNLVTGPSIEAGGTEDSIGMGASLGFGFGAGLAVTDKISVNGRYLMLGESEREIDSGGDYEQEFSFLQLSVGYRIK